MVLLQATARRVQSMYFWCLPSLLNLTMLISVASHSSHTFQDGKVERLSCRAEVTVEVTYKSRLNSPDLDVPLNSLKIKFQIQVSSASRLPRPASHTSILDQ
ncbi:hypothetical protein F4774DRAFT_380963 [Daldinia eschscholtzii]|nr:hypothetical protein F4774DRAFT_380963 [Daldinia eschscholtzii]